MFFPGKPKFFSIIENMHVGRTGLYVIVCKPVFV